MPDNPGSILTVLQEYHQHAQDLFPRKLATRADLDQQDTRLLKALPSLEQITKLQHSDPDLRRVIAWARTGRKAKAREDLPQSWRKVAAYLHLDGGRLWYHPPPETLLDGEMTALLAIPEAAVKPNVKDVTPPGLFDAQTPIRGARWSAERHSLSRLSFAKAPYCALLSAQPRPAAGRATPWPGPPCDRPPQSASVEEVSRLA